MAADKLSDAEKKQEEIASAGLILHFLNEGEERRKRDAERRTRASYRPMTDADFERHRAYWEKLWKEDPERAEREYQELQSIIRMTYVSCFFMVFMAVVAFCAVLIKLAN